jgi:hypothetical protein
MEVPRLRRYKEIFAAVFTNFLCARMKPFLTSFNPASFYITGALQKDESKRRNSQLSANNFSYRLEFVEEHNA